MTNLLGNQTAGSRSSHPYQSLLAVTRAGLWKGASTMTVLFSIFYMTGLVAAQKTEISRQVNVVQEMATSIPAPQLAFVGKEDYEANGAQGIRYKLSVTNRNSHPDFLWLPSENLSPCGNNQNAARTWVEVFGSPGGKRLSGFCALRTSEDLGHLWFPAPSGERAPACVYIVMTDRRTGKKYTSNRVCSRSFTVKNRSDSNPVGNERGRVRQPGTYPAVHQPPSVTQKSAGGRTAESNGPRKFNLAQPDLTIKQFLFPPTNDKAVRVQVENQGNAASLACRLLLTVRKINGTPVGRQTTVTIPALTPGKKVWLVNNAKSILPNNVSLQSTTFKLNADGSGIVAESDETNNEVWHNL